VNGLWELIGEDYGELAHTEEFKRLSIEAQASRLNKCTDEVVLRMCKTHLLQAANERDLLFFQAEVVAVMQLRNALVGKIGGGGSDGTS
jgi:hypothetical protein